MKKRILSLVLCLVMAIGLLPMQTFAEEAEECAHCSHIHWGDYICKDCGLCSDECSNSDCWYDTHCKNCGACYMRADNWCDECGWCDDCMKEAHCQDCGRCFVGEDKGELCENCGICSDHFEHGICEECNLCEECADDEHCLNCFTHLYGDELCGYCDECALELEMHCVHCEKCFESGEVDYCPVHPGGNHCEDAAEFICEQCQRCDYEDDDIDECIDCGLCKECCEENSAGEGCITGEVCIESDEWEDHVCSCGDCACVVNICSECGKCENCCVEANECEACECSQKEVSHDHEHKYRSVDYQSDENGHWRECLICKEDSTHEDHACTAARSVCDVCGWDTEKTLFFVIQPKDVAHKVSWDDAPEDHATHPKNNRVTFSVTAVNQAGEELWFEWYEVYKDKKDDKILYKKKLVDGGDHIVVSGATTNELTVSVPIEACIYNYEYYCVVTSRDASGTVIQEESKHAKLRALHNYGAIRPSDNTKYVKITWDDGYNTDTGNFLTGSKYHDSTCVGYHCGRSRLPAETRHNFVFVKYLGYGFYVDDTLRPDAEHYHFYIQRCNDCHYEELLATTKKLSAEELPYSITIEDSSGAYIMDDMDNKGITVAKAGDKLYAIAEMTDAAGHAFKEWQVVDGPDGFTIEPYIDGNNEVMPGWYEFFMPAGNVVLKAVYDEKQAISSVRIRKNDETQPVNGTLTVHVGDTFLMNTILTPAEDLANENIVWDVLHYDSADSANPQLIFATAQQGDKETSSKPMKGAVTLEAKAPGFVWLRAATQESAGQVKDVITVKVLPANEASGHAHIFDSGTVVPATCTQSGYTEYKCTVEGCNYRYQTNLKNATGHKDTDDDGRCNNLKRDGTLCDYQIANDGNTSMVGLTKIDKVELTVDNPVRSKVPADRDAVVPTGSDKDYFSVADVDWDPIVTSTFASGTPYTVLIKLEAAETYGFKLNGIIESNNTQFYINGNKATVVYRDAQQASISYKFPATGCEIIFDAQSGAASETSAQTGSDGKLASLPTASRSGYTFKGWYTEAKGGTQVTEDTVFTADTTVYAQWTYISPSDSAIYAVTILDSKNGSVTADREIASAGSTITLTVAPDKGYVLETLTVLDKSGKEIKLTGKDGKYTFIMPANGVEVKATFIEDNMMLNFFVDVKTGDYFYDAVLWAVKKGITRGTDATHFTPNGVCTRAQAVTFLWRAAGSPAPKSSVMPFNDVAANSYYYNAVLWAAENGIVKGTTETTFSPNEHCSRGQIVTLLWRSQKSPAAGSVNPFTDVKTDAYYADAVLWAVENSITKGTTETTFSPNNNCTRAQIVTFIYRALAK